MNQSTLHGLPIPPHEGGLLDQSAIPKYVATFCILFTVFILAVQRLSHSRQLTKFPHVGNAVAGKQASKSYFAMAADIWRVGYEKYRDVIWRYTSSDAEFLVVPIRYAEELRKLPDDVINPTETANMTFQSDYTYIETENPLLHHTIRSDLTPHLSELIGRWSKEVARTIPELTGPCEDWIDIVVYPKLLEIVATVSGYLFIGPELSRHPEYLDATMNFTLNAFAAAASLKRWPRILRPFAAAFLDARVAKLREKRKNLLEFLTPHIEKRRALRDQGAKDAPNDMLQWAINKAPKFNMDTNADIARTQAVLGIVAIHTTTSVATHFLYDIVAHCPEVIPELRQEVYSTLEANGGVYTAKSLAQMKLMDSVLKESQRLNPQMRTTFSRWVRKSVMLSDGTVIPNNIFITTGLNSVSRDETYYPEANHFNPYRFLDLRSGKVEDPLQYANKEQYQFISVTKENMSFGFGRHSCPGRFFAASEIKLIMAELLTTYDIRLPDGVKERYRNIEDGDVVSPDHTKAISFRKIQ